MVAELRGLDYRDAATRIVEECGLSLGAEIIPAPTPSPTPSGQTLYYVYHDRDGNPHSRKCRAPGKEFYIQARRGSSWVNGGPEIPILYHLDALVAEPDRLVFLVEGEKDADRLLSLGLLATTNIYGASEKWVEGYTEALKGHPVAVIPDHDEDGRGHVLEAADHLIGAGIEVRLIELPGLGPFPSKEDVSDWLDAGHTVEELKRLVKKTDPLTPEKLSQIRAGWGMVGAEPADKRGKLILTPVGELLSEPEEAIDFIVADVLPCGGLSVVVAKPKVGKSTTVRELGRDVARGEPFLGRETQAGKVFYLGLEEKRSEVRKHFRAMGVTASDPILVFIAASPVDGLAQLAAEIKEKQPALVIIDPLFRFIRTKDGNDYATVTAALEPVVTLARESGAHLMFTHHATKGQTSGGDSILGSTAIFGAVDTALILKRSDRYRTISSIQRYGVDLEETVLELDPETLRVTACGSRKEADEAHVSDPILEFLHSQTDTVEEREIQENVEGRKQILSRALRSLVEQDKVAREGLGKRGDPYRYFISGSLVPSIGREPENQKRLFPVSDSNNSRYSGSRKTAIFQAPGSRKEGIGSQKIEAEKGTEKVHPVNGEVPPVKGRPWKLPHYANRGKTTSSGGELASARSCFSTVRTALGKLRITGLLAQFDVARSFPQFPRPLLLQPTILTSERGTRFGIRKAPNHVPTSPFTG